MTIQQLIYFREVAKTLHFTKAAQNLYISQSALSYSIIALERELDVPLLHREGGRRLELTYYGELLLPLIENVIEGVDAIDKTIARARNSIGGVVNIAYSYMNGYKFLAKMFSEFDASKSFESITLNFMINHYSAEFEETVVSGDVDLAFSCMEHMDGLTTVPFARQRLYVALYADHPLAGRESLTIKDIAEEPLIGYHQYRNIHKYTDKMYDQYGLTPNWVEFKEVWTEQLLSVSLRRGIAVAPIQMFDSSLVKWIPLDDPLSIRYIYFMWASERKLSPAVEYVRDCCLNYFDEMPLI